MTYIPKPKETYYRELIGEKIKVTITFKNNPPITKEGTLRDVLKHALQLELEDGTTDYIKKPYRKTDRIDVWKQETE